MVKGSTFKNILVTLPRRHSEQWAYEMSVVVTKMSNRFLPVSVGDSLGPVDKVLPGSHLHPRLLVVMNSAGEVLPPARPINVRYYNAVEYAGQIYSINSGVQMAEVIEGKSVVTHACITRLMQLGSNDMLWVAELSPIRDIMANMGVLSGIMPTHDVTPAPKRFIWLNAMTMTASNIVRPGKCGRGRDVICWVIPQN